MEHPLVSDANDMTMEQLNERISDLNKKLSIAMRSGNGHLCNQIRMALETYNNKLKERIDEQYKSSTQNFDDKIKIS